MNVKRFILTVTAIFVFALLWNGIIHGLVLADAELALKQVTRPASEIKLLPALLLTFGIAIIFVIFHLRCPGAGGIRQGLANGVLFGVLAGLLVDLNQFVLYPIPGKLAFYWFVSGFCEFCIYGVIAALLYPVTPSRQ